MRGAGQMRVKAVTPGKKLRAGGTGQLDFPVPVQQKLDRTQLQTTLPYHGVELMM